MDHILSHCTRMGNWMIKLRHKETFKYIIESEETRHLVNTLLLKYTPVKVKKLIIKKYNDKIDEYNQRMHML